MAGYCGGDWNVLRDLHRMWSGGGEQNLRISDVPGNLRGLGIDCDGYGVFVGTHLWSALQPFCYHHIRHFSSLPLLSGLSLLLPSSHDKLKEISTPNRQFIFGTKRNYEYYSRIIFSLITYFRFRYT